MRPWSRERTTISRYTHTVCLVSDMNLVLQAILPIHKGSPKRNLTYLIRKNYAVSLTFTTTITVLTVYCVP